MEILKSKGALNLIVSVMIPSVKDAALPGL